MNNPGNINSTTGLFEDTFGVGVFLKDGVPVDLSRFFSALIAHIKQLSFRKLQGFSTQELNAFCVGYRTRLYI